MRFRFPRELWHELEPTPGRSTATARITLSVLLVVVVMLTFRMPFLSIGPYLVFLLAQKDMLLTRAAGALGIFTAAISFLLFYGVAALAWDLEQEPRRQEDEEHECYEHRPPIRHPRSV